MTSYNVDGIEIIKAPNSEKDTSLIPKYLASRCLKEFGPLATYSAIRKLLGYMWMLSFPPHLPGRSFQAAFLLGRNAAQAVFLIQRCCEISEEWNLLVCCAQLDLKKVFDKAKHSTSSEPPFSKGVPVHHVAILDALWTQRSMTLKLSHIGAARSAGLHHGAPESPLVFTMLLDEILGTLASSWPTRGLGL